MSERSNAWYSLKENASRRKARMRAYNQALTMLGQRHAGERRHLYRQGREEGRNAGSDAQNYAMSALRRRYPEEFSALFSLTRLGQRAEGGEG